MALRAATLLAFHQCLVSRKYRALFSSSGYRKLGPKDPSAKLVRVVVELKRRTPRVGCPRIALIIARTFGVEIDKDVARRILAKHFGPEPGLGGPSWLTFIGFGIQAGTVDGIALWNGSSVPPGESF